MRIHAAYIESGAGIIRTDTLNSSAVSLADYGLEAKAYAINVAAAKLARRAVEDFNRHASDKPRFIAGAIGPTNRTASLSPDVNSPAYRAVTFTELVQA